MLKIGFMSEKKDEPKTEEASVKAAEAIPVCSVAEVYFPQKDMSFAYYNDLFDLHKGDMVYVEGKLEGMIGRVIAVNYNFKIKLSDYKRVIAVVDTKIKGQLYFSGDYFTAFNRNVIPKEKIKLWFKAPDDNNDFVTGHDNSTFPLDDLKKMHVSPSVEERGYAYFEENRVRYISLDGEKGYAIVEGSEVYEVEFTYRDSLISDLVCSCYCGYDCKHEVAAMLLLREILEYVMANYDEEYCSTDYFASVLKSAVFYFAMGNECKGSLVF